MKDLILISLFLFAVLAVNSQSIDGEQFKKAKIFLKDHSSLNVKKLSVKKNESFFINTVNGELEQLTLDKVNTIKAAKGSYLVEGASYTGIVCLGAAVVASSGKDTSKPTTGEFVGFVVGGAVLGALVGSLFPKWKEVYSKGEFLSQNVPINLGIDTQKDKVVVKITIPL